ncbi:hypothetical protein HY968_03885 [Candidatus Kaiserbacteria bacterium]|nr:hypothetical protein [Candidatus Kaiserbacteria bacterium]
MMVLILFPLLASAQAANDQYKFSREGIFGCSRSTAALPQSVGAFSATGGVYVPVADYTVELNTGVLVYQQCVLRGIVDRMSESANTSMNKIILTNTNTGGDDGGALFRKVPKQEDSSEYQRVALLGLNNMQSSPDSLTKTVPQVLQTTARGVLASMHPLERLSCPYQGNMDDVWSQRDTSQAALDALADSRCDPVFGYIYRKEYIDSQAASAIAERILQVQSSGGYYAKTSIDENGNRVIETPSSVIGQTTQLAINSGYVRVQNANDVDQMVGALFAGLASQIVSGNQGLSGIMNRIGNQPSYLDQVTAESAVGLRNAAANAALQVLAGARSVEQQYYSVVTAIANLLTSTINQLRSAENQCWNLIINKVCSSPPTAPGNTCPAVGGGTLHVATTTVASQAVIAAQITPLANQTIQNVQASQKALSLIDKLIAGITNTASLDAQRLALVQLDQLVAQRLLHQAGDVTQVQQQQGAITSTMQDLVTNTVKTWADSTDPATGWCNVNNAAVLDMWKQRWKQ